jgi:hypothetical protein
MDVHNTAVNTEKIMKLLEIVIITLATTQKQDVQSVLNNTSVATVVSSTVTQVADASTLSTPPTLDIQQKIAKDAYDVYICYDEADVAEAMDIGEKLKAYGILPWLDALVSPGRFGKRIQNRQIEKIPSAAVFVGQHKIVDQQELQMYSFIEEFLYREIQLSQ